MRRGGLRASGEDRSEAGATALAAPVVHWGLGWLLWHRFGLQLKAVPSPWGNSPATNESCGYSKEADSLGTRTSCLALAWA